MAKEANKTNSNNFAQEYTNNYLEGEVIPGIMAENRYAKEFIPEITLQECNDLIKTWVTKENFVYYLTAPQQEGYRVPSQQDVLAIYNRASNAKYAAWVDNYKDEPLYSKQLPAVTPKLTKTNTVLDYKEYTCPNGVKFIVKKTDLKDDEIQMNSFAWGGTSLYSDQCRRLHRRCRYRSVLQHPALQETQRCQRLHQPQYRCSNSGLLRQLRPQGPRNHAPNPLPLLRSSPQRP